MNITLFFLLYFGLSIKSITKPKNKFGSKIFCIKNVWSKKIFGYKKFGVEKMMDSKLFESQKNLRPNRLLLQNNFGNFRYKNFDSNWILDQRKF